MNPISSDIFGRLSWLTKAIKHIYGRLTALETGASKSNGNNPCYLEITTAGAGFPYTTLADYNTNTDWATPFTNLVTIGDSIQRLYGGSDVYLSNIFGENTNITSINDGCGIITGIGDDAFSGCTNLTYINLPSLTSISISAFSYCSSLVNIDLPQVVSIGNGAFNNCTNLSSITGPKVTTILSSAFNTCTSLTTVLFPKLTNIGASAFNFCTGLITVNFPLVTSVDDNGFSSSSAITSVNLPLATYLGVSIFDSCTSLTTINLSSVTNLGGTPGMNNVFVGISGNTINITVPVAMETIDGGDPDSDIVYLSDNNTLTVNYV